MWQIKKAEEIRPCVEVLTSQVLRAPPRSPRQLLHGVCLGSSNSVTTSFLSVHCAGKPASHITSQATTTGDNRRKGSPLKFYLLLVTGRQGTLPRPFWSSWRRCCCHWQCTADLSHQQCWSPTLRQAKEKADEKKLKASNILAVLLVGDCILPHCLAVSTIQKLTAHDPFQSPFHCLEKTFSLNWSWKQKRDTKCLRTPGASLHKTSASCFRWVLGSTEGHAIISEMLIQPSAGIQFFSTTWKKRKVFCISHEVTVNHYLWATRDHLWQVFCELGNRVRKGGEH